jgi:hypothetical protein
MRHGISHPQCFVDEADPCLSCNLIGPRRSSRYYGDSSDDGFVIVTVRNNIAFSSYVLGDDEVLPDHTGIGVRVQFICAEVWGWWTINLLPSPPPISYSTLLHCIPIRRWTEAHEVHFDGSH